MKGTTELHVTQATIVAAVQLYLDGQFMPGRSPVVTSVKSKSGIARDPDYSVMTEERKVEERVPVAGPYSINTDVLKQKLEVLPSDAYTKRMVGGERE